MGSSASSPVPLAPAFQRMSTWELKSAKRLLQDYKDKDLDFGLDAQALSELLAGDKDWASEIIDAFSSTNGMYGRTATPCGSFYHPMSENLVFDALDFDATEQISMDEMTIVFLCATRGFCVASGISTVPSDEDLENVTLSAYRELNKSSGQSISKAEFTKWVLKFAAGDSTHSHSEVTIESAMEQFGIASPPKVGVVAYEEEVVNPAGGDDNNPPDQQAIGHYQVETEAQSAKASAFDEAYQAHEVAQAQANEEEQILEPKPQQYAPESSYEENPNEYKEAPGFEAEASGEPLEMTHASSAHGREGEQEVVVVQPEEAQEDYEREFAAETPRDAQMTVVVEEMQQRERDETGDQTPQEEETYAEESSSAVQLDSEAVGEEPSTPANDELLVPTKAQGESDLTDQNAEANLQAETEENFEERVAAELETSQEETITPVPSARVEEEEEEHSSPEPTPPPAFEAPELEPDANCENDGYDLPTARSDDNEAAATADPVSPSETSAETEKVAEPLPVPSSEEEINESLPKRDTTKASDGGGVVDLNDFEAYDYTQSEYDASSGLPPPEDPAGYAVEESGADGVAQDPDSDRDAAAASDEAASILPNEETDAKSGSSSAEEDVGAGEAASTPTAREQPSEEA